MNCNTSTLTSTSSKNAASPPWHTYLPSMAKTIIVAVLAWLLAWRPTLAMLLGQIIWRLLPWLKEA